MTTDRSADVDPLLAARDEDLRLWRSEYPAATPISELTPRHPATAVGVVTRVRLVPRKSIEVDVEDGTGRLAATWTGRTRLPGVQLGAGLRLTGTVAVDSGGTVRMRNPEYALVAEPYR
jgi:hypothetical protein